MKVKGKEKSVRIFKISEDLYLKQFEISDAMDLYSVVETQREYINLCWVPLLFPTLNNENDEEVVFDPISVLNDFIAEHEFVIVFRNEIIGLAGFKNYNKFNRNAHLGCFIMKSFYGMGLVIPSMKVLMDFAFFEMEINKLQIKSPLGNLTISSIPRKLGFRIEGIEREGEFIDGKATDLEVYGMTKEEYVYIRSEQPINDAYPYSS